MKFEESKKRTVKRLDRIDLQLFADGDQDNPAGGGTPPANPPADPPANPPNNDPEGKFYTQSELDEMFSKRASRAKEKALNDYKKSDEFKQFKQFLEDNKTAEQKNKERLQELEGYKNRAEELERQLSDYKNIEQLREKNIDSKYHKFINFEVKQMVEEGKDFNTALEEYLTANPDYVGTTTTGITTGRRNTNGHVDTDLDELRKAMGVYKRPNQNN